MPPSSVTSWSASVDQLVAWSTPHWPTSRSVSTSVSLSHEIRQQAHENSPDYREPERERQREAGCRGRVEASPNYPKEPRMPLHLRFDALRCSLRRSLADDRRRVAQAHVRDQRPGRE